MTLEQTIQCMLDFSGDMFRTRKHCLDHLFCTIGNGYEWINGELVSDDYKEQLERWSLGDIEKAVEISENIEIWENIERPMYIKKAELSGNKYSFWYPLSKDYSYLYNYPEDIKPDWLEGIKETLELLKKDGIEI